METPEFDVGEILPGHPGWCELAEHFTEAAVEREAERVSRDYSGAFARFGARPVILPIRITFRQGRFLRKGLFKGEGIRFELRPVDDASASTSEWWGYHEADLMVRARQKGTAEWKNALPPREVYSMLVAQAEAYLRQLEMGPGQFEEASARHRTAARGRRR